MHAFRQSQTHTMQVNVTHSLTHCDSANKGAKPAAKREADKRERETETGTYAGIR